MPASPTACRTASAAASGAEPGQLYNQAVRKAIGIAGLAACFFLACTEAQADSARDGIANPGNAKQLGAVERDTAPDPAPHTESDSTEVAMPVDVEGAASDHSSCDCSESCSDCGCDSCNSCSSCNECLEIEFFGPMGIINMHPTNAIFLTPVPERASLLGNGRRSFSFKLDMANSMIRELDSGIIASFDFEEYQFSGEYRQGTGQGEFMVTVPIRYRSAGTFDGLITDWHKFFGLPRGLRDDYPNQLYQYVIVTRDGAVFNDEGDSFGIGDIRLGYKHSLRENADGSEALAVRGTVKLPTGDSSSALGSGGMDFSLGALYQTPLTNHMRAYFNADYIFIGTPDWQNIEHRDAHSYSAALEYAVSHSSTIVGQFRVQSNPLRIGSFEADKDSQELQFGWNTRLSDRTYLTLGFSEDANPETAPDFGINSYLTWEF